jgi:hypothetical protein
MINLLPPDIKQDMHYGRRNVILMRWLAACSFALGAILIIIAIGYLYLSQTAASQARQTEAARQNLESQNVGETQKKIEEMSNNIKLSTQVLSREILFSKLLRQLGASLPADTSLQEFQVDKLQGGLTLRGGAKNINAATQLQVNLQDPNNKIFEKADIENISCAPAVPNVPYPCTVQIRALFAKNNPYLYISPTTGTAQQ